MKIKCEAKVAKLLLRAAEAANDECLFQFGKDAVEIKQMDPSQISMVSFSIPKSKFMEYSVEGEKEMLLFHVKDVLKAVSKAGENVEIEKKGNKLCIKSIGLGMTSTFNASLIDQGGNFLGKTPTLAPAVKIVLKTSELKKAITDISELSGSSHIAFKYKDNSFKVSGLGDKNEAAIDFDTEKSKNISVDAPKDEKGVGPKVDVIYPFQYLIDLLGAISSSDVRLELKTNSPLVMKDTELDITCFLAPRVDND